MLDIPFWQAAAGIALTLVTIVIFAAVGAKIYKGGVLIYGNASGFKAIKQALRISKNKRKQPGTAGLFFYFAERAFV